MYLNCKRSFYLQKVLGLQYVYPEGPRKCTSADIGTWVHRGMELLLTEEADVFELTDREYLETEFTRLALEEMEVGADELPEDWTKQLEIAIPMTQRSIQYWTDRETGIGDWEVVAVEQKMEWRNIDGLGVTLEGTLDAYIHDTYIDRYLILDHKTVANMARQLPQAGNFQGKTYGVLCHYSNYELPSLFYHHQIKRVKGTTKAAKPPFNDLVYIHMKEQELRRHAAVLRRLVHDIVEFIDTIDREGPESHWLEAVPNYTGECDWRCRARDLCTSMDVGSDWRLMAAAPHPATPASLSPKEDQGS